MNPILKQILTSAPQIIEAASRIYDRFAAQAEESLPVPTQDSHKDVDSIRSELEKIEQLNRDQSAIVMQLAEQQKALAESAAKLAVKANIGIVLATASLLVSLVSAVITA